MVTRREGTSLSPYRRFSPAASRFGSVAESMFDDFFSQLFSETGQLAQDGTISPPLNVSETEKSFEVQAEMPGVKKDDLKISIDNRRITIEADIKEETRQEGENLIYAERTARKYARSITLPVDIDDAGAQARLEDGMLKLTLPKKEPVQPKKIAVQ